MPFKGHARKGVVGLHASVPEIFRILTFLCPLRWLLQLYLKPISLFVLLQWWNCVVDWSRRLPTLTICKRSSLWCVDCPMLPWQPATRCWLFARNNAWWQITFLYDETSQLIYPHKFEVCKCPPTKNFILQAFTFQHQKPNWKEQTGICEAELTRGTIKLGCSN